MNGWQIVLAAAVLAAGPAALAQRGGRPAPSPSRFGYAVKIDADTLPRGVTVREVRDNLGARLFISNSSDVPLVLGERFQGDTLVGGTKLVSGKVYQYFPSGVPMEGKTHLKGWQAPFGEIKETLLTLPREPERITAGRKPGLTKDVPPPEPVAIMVKFDGRPAEIKGTIHYHLNEAYDAYYREPGKNEGR